MVNSQKSHLVYPKTIKFELSEEETKQLFEWREEVERTKGMSLEGITVSFTIMKTIGRQIIVKPATYDDLKLKGVPKNDGSYDKFDQDEEIIEEYDNLGFASTPVKWDSLRIVMLFCDGGLLGRNISPKCYIRLLKDESLFPISVCTNPSVLVDDVIVGLFGYKPIEHEVFQKIRMYIQRNIDAILRHWRGETSSIGLLKELTPVDNM